MQSLLDNKTLMMGAGLLALLVGILLLLVIAQMLFRKVRLPGGRTRQARLGIVDAFDLDRQRQLIIIRRDNTEHLIMIGGPNDVVIESEILRVESRENRREKFDGPVAALPLAASLGEPRGPVPAPFNDRIEPPPARLTDSAPPPASPPSVSLPPQGSPPAQGSPQPAVRTPAPPSPAKPAIPQPPAAAGPQNGAPAPVPVQPPVVLAPAEGEGPARRLPSFPLPPRRPLPQAEPRPAPRPFENASRTDPVLPAPATEAAPPEAAPASPPPAPPAPVIPPVAALEAAALRPVPSQFLRPLPPRPAKVPLRAPPAAASPPPPAPALAAPLPQPEPVAEPQKSAAAGDSHIDTLESLEEEMAKLLGRGVGEN